jgi:hypothetical protein
MALVGEITETVGGLNRNARALLPKYALYGRRVRVQGSQSRSNGRFYFVESAPGNVTVLPEWMLDPVLCAGMAMGAPRVTVAALIHLQRQLIDAGFRRTSPGDGTIVREERDEHPFEATAADIRRAPVQSDLRSREAAGLEPGRTCGGGEAVGRPAHGSRGRCGGGA